MKNCLTALLLGLLSPYLIAQEFQLGMGTFESQYCYESKQLPDRSLISVGYAAGLGEGQGSSLITRNDIVGDVMWSNVYTSAFTEDCLSIDLSQDGSIFTTGYHMTEGNVDANLFVYKINPDGTLAFAKSIGDMGYDAATDIICTAEDQLFVSGYASSFNQGGSTDGFMALLDLEGEVIWAKGFDFGVSSNPKAACQSASGTLWSSNAIPINPQGGYDGVLTGINADGSEFGSYVLTGGLGHDLITGIVPYGTGMVAYGDTDNLSAGQRDGFVAYINENLQVEWSYVIGGESSDHITDVVVDQDMNLTFTGTSSSFGAGGLDVFIGQITSEGILNWAKTYGGPSKDVANTIMVTQDDGYALTGYTRSFSESFSDVYLIKTNERGDCPCNQSGLAAFTVTTGAYEMEAIEIETYEITATSNDLEISIIDFEELENNVLCSEGVVEDLNDSALDDDDQEIDTVTSIAAVESQNTVEAYPNPSEGLVYLTLPRVQQSQVLEIYSVTGTLITRKTVPPGHDGAYPLDLSDLGGGVYLVRMDSPTGIFTKKLTIR